MLSRRFLRILIFQYLFENLPENAGEAHRERYLTHRMTSIEKELIFLVQFCKEVLKYAETQAGIKKAKLLPQNTDAEEIIAHIPFLARLNKNQAFPEKVREYKPEQIFPLDSIRHAYLLLSQTDEFGAYILNQDDKTEEHLLRCIFNMALDEESEIFQILCGSSIHYENDGEVIVKLLNTFLRSIESYPFRISPDGDSRDFYKQLTGLFFDKQEYINSIVEPKLNNWERERLAKMDILFIHLGICELLYFPEIPTIVSINEYIELAKTFSTDQSGSFVNGILDSVKKELEAQGEIKKFNN